MSRIFTSLSLAVAAVGVFGIGFLLGGLDRGETPSRTDHSNEEVLTAKRLTALHPSGQRDGRGRSFAMRLRGLDKDAESLRTEIRETVSGLEQLDGDALLDALTRLLDLYSEKKHSRGYEYLKRQLSVAMHDWAELDGAAAMSYLKSHLPFDSDEREDFATIGADLVHSGDSLYYTALYSWAKTDLVAAEQWARSERAEELRRGGDREEVNAFLRPVVHALAGQDLERASDLANEIGYAVDGIMEGEVFNALLGEHLKLGWESTRDWLFSTRAATDDFHRHQIRDVTNVIARQDVVAAAAFADSLDDSRMRRSAYRAVISAHWGKSPEAAVAWANQITDKSRSAEAHRIIVGMAQAAASFGRESP